MANSVQVGDIVVRLIADSKQLDSELKKAGANLDTLGKKGKQASHDLEASFAGTSRLAGSLVTRLAALAAAFVSVNAVIGAFNRQMDSVTALDNLSQATGVSVERLSQLRNVAIATGIDFETVGRALAQFGPRMTEALASGSSRGSQALRALGVDVRDAQGNIRQLDELLPELSDAFSRFADGSNKAAIAAALFGEEAGPRMIPLLNRGRAGLDELRRVLGGTFSQADVQRARDYQIATGQLQVAFDRLVREITSSSAAIAVINTLAKSFKALADTVRSLNQAGSPLFAGDLERLRQQAQMMRERNQLLGEAADVMRRLTAANLERWRAENPEEVARLNQRYVELTAALQRLRAQYEALGRTPRFDTTVTRTPPQAPPLDPFALERAQMQLQQLMDRLSGTRSIFDSINLSWDEHSRVVQQAIAQIDRAHAQAHQRQNARYNLERQLELRKQEQMLQTATTAAQTITMLWPKSKGAAIASAIINTAVGVTRALSSMDPPWSFVTAALIAAQGAAQIATIRSTNEDGTGGNAASPQAPVAAEGAQMGRALHVTGIDPAAIFSGGQVRGLIDQINDEVRNGATLISTGTLPL